VGSLPEAVGDAAGGAAARIARAVDLLVRGIAAVSIAVLSAVVLVGVGSRALGDPYAWTDELSRLLMVWVAMFGWMLASRRHAHIRIRFFHDLLPPFAWSIAEIVMQLSVVVFGLLVVLYGAELVERNHDVEAISLPFSMMWFYVPLVAAGGLAAVQAAVDIKSVWMRRAEARG
jgi:TRAP-type C4-dicarboxylate transport system permease small subunit